jgi:peptidoglycan/xylan/chitin deacetylase (PgdA/CDA1 family)
MRKHKAGFLAGAFIAAIGASLAAGTTRAQEPGLDSVQSAAQPAVQTDAADVQAAAQKAAEAAAQNPEGDVLESSEEKSSDRNQSGDKDGQQKGMAEGGAVTKDGGSTSSEPTKSDTGKTAAAAASNCPGNPDAIGTSRVISIDPSEYKRVGRLQYPETLPLNDKEVVLTFDDGPLPPYSNQILDILAAQCVKVNYFLVGAMARAYPSVVRRMYEEGHTIGTHSDTHPLRFGELPLDRLRHEIDGGIADVSAALGDSRYLAPFFRFPGFARSDMAENELAERSLTVFSTDAVADDWHSIGPAQIVSLALKRLEARGGKGMLLLHDIHARTVAALPALLKALKDNGYHLVQVVPAPSYVIAAASKPMRPMLASAIPGEIAIGGSIDGSAQAAWPDSTDKLAPEEVVLPVADPSAFEPESGIPKDTGSVTWPNPPETRIALDSSEGPARVHGKRASRGRKDEDVTGSIGHRRTHEHQRAEESRGQQHGRARAGTEGHHADLSTKIESLAAMLTPAQPAH